MKKMFLALVAVCGMLVVSCKSDKQTLIDNAKEIEKLYEELGKTTDEAKIKELQDEIKKLEDECEKIAKDNPEAAAEALAEEMKDAMKDK